MNARRRIIVWLLGLSLLYAPQSSAFDPVGEDPNLDRSSITVTTHSSSSVKNAFTYEDKAINAYLYRLRLMYYPVTMQSGNRSVGHLVHISFPLTHIFDMTPSSAGEMRLIIDRNGNLAPDDEDEIIARSTVNFTDKQISFSVDAPLQEGANDLFLVGDFPNLMPKAELRIKFNDRLLVVRELDRANPVTVLGTGYDEVWHRRGNSPPEVSYSVYIKDIKNGVSPWKGRSGDVFTFETIYNDRDGDGATAVEVWIDFDGDGEFNAKERFSMQPTDSYGNAFNKRYQFRTRIIPKGSGKVMYRFFAHDGKDEAIGQATKTAELTINRALVIGSAQISTNELVPGERFAVRYAVRYFFDSVKIDWSSIEKQNFSPFLFIGSVHKDRREVTLLYDEEILTIWLEVPADLPEGMRYIPSLPFQALWYDLEKKEDVELHSFAPEVAVSLVGLRAFLEVMPTRVVTAIGDPLQIRLTIIKKPEAQLISHPEQEITFTPFTEVQPLTLSEVKRAKNDTLIYTAVIDPLMATNGRMFEIASYRVEYRWTYPLIRTFTIPATPISTVAILTPEQIKGPLLVFPRPPLSSAYYADMKWAARLSRTIFSILFSVVLVSAVYPCLRFLYAALRQSDRYQKMTRRMTWVSLVRAMAHESTPLSNAVLARLERAFRSYLACVYHCSGEEAQSVLLWEYIAKRQFLDANTARMVEQSLVLLRSASEGRATAQEADMLIALQQRLRTFI
ncbi:MAG: hypothetical protein U1A25_01115 [Candidatus Sungbacteria bacterium]|nr:hypothetical protein [bacterium]MDZ4260239.1 hypothetical protein [Candidatus Sungbacteria bacterium]